MATARKSRDNTCVENVITLDLIGQIEMREK